MMPEIKRLIPLHHLVDLSLGRPDHGGYQRSPRRPRGGVPRSLEPAPALGLLLLGLHGHALAFGLHTAALGFATLGLRLRRGRLTRHVLACAVRLIQVALLTLDVRLLADDAIAPLGMCLIECVHLSDQ